MKRVNVLTTVLAAAVLIGAGREAVASDTWNGQGGNQYWKTDLNWQDGGNPGNNFSEDLFFGGTSQLNNFNDLTGGTATFLSFQNGAGQFVLTGESFILGLADDQ